MLLLAACSAAGGTDAREARDTDDLIECAVGGVSNFTRECLVEQSQADEDLILTVRHPDGGFRRFVATDDGMGVAPADGAQAAKVSLHEGGIEVAVGIDRYRFPATVTDRDGR